MPTAHRTPSIAVIGAGLSGLACAHALLQRTTSVMLFDRGRRPGGRLSGRRLAISADHSVHADHGAPFFTADDPEFQRTVERWTELGLCAHWPADVRSLHSGHLESVPSHLYTGTPRMRAPIDHLVEGLDLRTGITVHAISKDQSGWRLECTSHDGSALTHHPFDAVVVAAAPAQIARLISDLSPSIAQDLAAIETSPCWSHTVLIDNKLTNLPDVLLCPEHPVIERIIRDDRKPGREHLQGHSRLVVQAHSYWSEARLDADPVTIGALLLESVRDLLAALSPAPVVISSLTPTTAHRWSFANTRRPIISRCSADPDLNLIACGDGFGGIGIQSAWLSGIAAAQTLLGWNESGF